MAIVQLVAVAVPGAPFSGIPEAFDPLQIHQITDDDPCLLLAIAGGGKPAYKKGQKGMGRLDPVDSDMPSIDGGRWYRVPVLNKAQMSETRPLGYGELNLARPKVSLRYYLWPHRLFGRAQWLAMLADVEQETGICPWGRTETPRVAIDRITEPGTADLLAFLECLNEEIRAAGSLLRRPYSHIWADEYPTSGRLPDLPENRLILRWAARRAPRIRRLALSAKGRVRELEADAARTRGNPLRAGTLAAPLERRRQELHRVNAVSTRFARLHHALKAPRDDGGLMVTPAMHRDHRLRLLLKAMRPTTTEKAQSRMAQRSTLPPLRTPDLFELWGAVWFARRLRSMGWHGHGPKCRGAEGQEFASGLYRAQWRLSRGDIQLLFDWSLDPKVVPACPVDQRTSSALEWSARRSRQDSDEDLVLACRANSPDYIVRMSGPKGMAFAIGDASLADPNHQGGQKIDKISQYAREVAWLPAGCDDPVMCAPLGLFVLLPRCEVPWKPKLRATASACDCRLLFAKPGGHAEEDGRDIDRLIEYLVGLVC